MQHAIPVPQLVDQFGPQVELMAQAVQSCVHCGFCLPDCPTYNVLGEEMDSPRGRIILMKSVLEGELDIEAALPYVDRCLGCLACVSACPSGVKYGELISPFRAYAQEKRSFGVFQKVQHSLVQGTLPYKKRFRSAAMVGRFARPFRSWMPDEIGNILSLLPDRLPKTSRLPGIVLANGTRRARVALLAGCVQQVLAPEINLAALRVLARNGVEVIIPPDQVCCGALSMHSGDRELALKLARQNLSVFPGDVDAIITNAAGCGSGMKDYGLLFLGTEQEEIARDFSKKVKDISQFLDHLGIQKTPDLPKKLKVAYHDACHLAHAQGVRSAPRSLLMTIPGLELVDFPEVEMCCGSAGTYNIEQPDIASTLGKRKAQHILDSGAEAVVTGNIGCIIQIRKQLQTLGKSLPVFHTFELLDMAYSKKVV